MLKNTASYILYSFVAIVTLFAGAAGAGVQGWAPSREDLKVISLRSAIIVNATTILITAGLVYLLVKTFTA